MVYSCHDGRLYELLLIIGNPASDKLDCNMAIWEVLRTTPKYVIDAWAEFQYPDYRVNEGLKQVLAYYYD